MSVMCLVCVLFHGSLYPLFPFYEMFFLSCRTLHLDKFNFNCHISDSSEIKLIV